MSLLSQFELPLPIVKVSVDKIAVETQSKYDGVFTIQNIGGGNLEGSITSNSKMISFLPSEFEGNKVDVQFFVDISTYRIGDIIQTSALVMSNGGEIVVPVIIKIMPPAIVTKDGERIASLKDFLWYAKTKPVAARQLFTQMEFMMWLFSMNYEHMELYEAFASDPNKERAVDNFLILNKLKKRADIHIPATEKEVIIEVPSYSKDMITGTIQLQKNGWGYLDLDLIVEPPVPWLTLFKNRLTASDFDEEGICSIDFFINPAKVKQKKENIVISAVSDNYSLNITVIANVVPPLSAQLSKSSFDYEDTGYVLIENKKGSDMTIDLQTNCPHIKFDNQKYIIHERAKIPFYIRVGALTTAQNFLSKQNVIYGNIVVIADRRLFILGVEAKLETVLPFVIAKPIVQ